MIEKDYYNGWNDESNLNKIFIPPRRTRKGSKGVRENERD